MGQHTEALQVTYDPEVVTYGDLLEVFWDSHRPVREPHSRQYRSAIFVSTPEQRREATRSLTAREEVLGQKVFTSIEDQKTFWPAEAYHQKYRLRRRATVVAALEERWPGGRWVERTEASRLNGLFGGYAVQEAPERLGVTGPALEEVRAKAAVAGRAAGPAR